MARHPYYPQDLQLHHYAENTVDLASLFAGFATGVSIILGAALLLAQRRRPSISALDRFLVLWFVLCEYPGQSTPRMSSLTNPYQLVPFTASLKAILS